MVKKAINQLNIFVMTENEYVSVGEKIKEVFKNAGLIQQDVAEILNITQSTIAKLLATSAFGKKSAKKWSEAFGFRPNWLLTGEGDMFTSEHPKVYEYKNGVNYGNILQSIKTNTGCVTGQVSGGQVINIPNFKGQKIIEPSGKMELHGDALSAIEKLEIENNALQQRIADLEKMLDMKDKLILMLEKNLKSFE